MKQVVEIFQLFDTDKSHSIDEDELRVLLLAFGMIKSKEEVAELCHTLGKEGQITFQDFAEWIQNEKFSMFYLGLDENSLYDLAKEVGQSLSREACREIMTYCDQDQDGVLSLSDFEWMEDFMA